MTIDAATVAPDNTTHVSATGGSFIPISSSRTGPNKVIAHFDAETDFLSRTTIECTIKDPVVLESAPGGYSQARESIFVKIPMTLANGNRTVNTANVTFARDPEMTEADFIAFRLMVTHLIGTSTFDAFWLSHNLS